MKFARSRRRVLCAFAGLAAAYAAPACAADDKSTIFSVMELVGVSSDPDARSIDYSERPKLVLPPSRGALPEPSARGSRPAGWPAEASTDRARNANRYSRVPNAPAETKQPGFLERALASGSGSNAPVADEPTRRMLVEPPAGYRRPTTDLSKVRDADANKSSWWNPMSYLGGSGGGAGDDGGAPNPAANDTRGSGRRVAATGARGGSKAAASDNGSDDGVLSRIGVPSFLRGSSDNN